jgi:hypothetical protein
VATVVLLLFALVKLTLEVLLLPPEKNDNPVEGDDNVLNEIALPLNSKGGVCKEDEAEASFSRLSDALLFTSSFNGTSLATNRSPRIMGKSSKLMLVTLFLGSQFPPYGSTR